MPPTPYEVEGPPSSSTTTTRHDVIFKVSLKLKQALTGFEQTLRFEYLGGKQLKIEKTGVTKHRSEDVYLGLGR
jgi:hypothetical protein